MFDSLTENGKGVLKLIIKEQINQMAKQKDGPNFKGRERNLTKFSGGRSKVVVKQFLDVDYDAVIRSELAAIVFEKMTHFASLL